MEEGTRRNRLRFRKGKAESFNELSKDKDFFRIRFIVNPIHAGRFQRFQLLGSSHIGKNHELFDKTVAIQTWTRMDILNMPRLIPNNLFFRDFQIKSSSEFSRFLKQSIRPIKRFDN